jgi:hypothetical protein
MPILLAIVTTQHLYFDGLQGFGGGESSGEMPEQAVIEIFD